MVRVVFEHVHGAADALESDSPAGSRLMDVCDELEAPVVPFSCRDASCGTCLITVLEGATLLEPADVTERRTLAALHAGADQRLACRARLRGQGQGRLRLRPDGVSLPD